MNAPASKRLRGQRGQASVELVAALPFVALVAALVWQCAVTGHAAWLVAHAARAGARAEAVGEDPDAAARSAVPKALERGMRVEAGEGGEVEVSLRVPLLLHHWRTPLEIAASASLGGAP